MTGPNYVLNQDADLERDRLSTLQQLVDGRTFDELSQLGVGPGWRCLEFGPGRGSLLRWLSERVSRPDGQVTGIDIETSALGELDRSRITVIEGDAAAIDLGDQRYDLIVGRAFFQHIPAREDSYPGVRPRAPAWWLALGNGS